MDDVLVVTNSCAFRASLFRALSDRFGPLTVNLVSTLHTGIQIVRLSNGGVVLTQDDAFFVAASLVGVSSFDPVLVPTDMYFFFLLLVEMKCFLFVCHGQAGAVYEDSS